MQDNLDDRRVASRRESGWNVESDVPCSRCGYNLRTLSSTGLCPECAAPVAESLQGWYAPPSRSRQRVSLKQILMNALAMYAPGGLLMLHHCGGDSALCLMMFAIAPTSAVVIGIPLPGAIFPGGMILSIIVLVYATRKCASLAACSKPFLWVPVVLFFNSVGQIWFFCYYMRAISSG